MRLLAAVVFSSNREPKYEALPTGQRSDAEPHVLTACLEELDLYHAPEWPDPASLGTSRSLFPDLQGHKPRPAASEVVTRAGHRPTEASSLSFVEPKELACPCAYEGRLV